MFHFLPAIWHCSKNEISLINVYIRSKKKKSRNPRFDKHFEPKKNPSCWFFVSDNVLVWSNYHWEVSSACLQHDYSRMNHTDSFLLCVMCVCFILFLVFECFLFPLTSDHMYRNNSKISTLPLSVVSYEMHYTHLEPSFWNDFPKFVDFKKSKWRVVRYFSIFSLHL